MVLRNLLMMTARPRCKVASLSGSLPATGIIPWDACLLCIRKRKKS